ncbi:MAG: amino acid racemase [Candidatus Daviesbacteria bacterium]|nr:amino acid racemase [Candidatus Daviesbacteria bacterium]
MKTVGIIGGLGPETTAKFYLEIVKAFNRDGISSRPKIIIYSVPLPILVEKESIIEAKNEERCLPFLIDAAKSLEKGGADFLVMPCNSLHIFIKEIQESVKIPVLNVIDETINYLKNQNEKKVGVLATSITINRGLYKQKLASYGIEEIVPDDTDQSKIGEIIYNLVMDKSGDADQADLHNIIQNLEKRGAKYIILACTDLQLLTPMHSGVTILDTMEILVNATVYEMKK